MCITSLALQLHPEFPFILIDNRDEEVDRPTGDLSFQNGIIRVEDLVSHGTWMGFNTNNGNFAVLTNVEEVVSYKKNAISRGKLVDLLLQDLNNEQLLYRDWKEYNGFNMIYGNVTRWNERNENQIFYTTNRTSQNEQHLVLPSFPVKIPLASKQCYCVSNSSLDDVNWKKVSFLKSQVQTVVSKFENCTNPIELRNALVDCLCQRPQFPLEELPQHLLQEISSQKQCFENPNQFSCSQQSYYDCTLEHFANIFINYKESYKTVGQTILLIDKSCKLYYYYRRTDFEAFQLPTVDQFSTRDEFLEAWNQMLNKNWQAQIVQL